MTARMTSKERVLAAIRRADVDYVPCSPLYNPLYPEQRIGRPYTFPWGPSEMEMADYNANKLGTDPVLSVDVERYEPAPGVSSRAWLSNGVLHKAYATPAGELHAAVRYNVLWPHGMNIPFFSDFNVGHFDEPWIKTGRDLECLKHVFVPAHSDAALAEIAFDFSRVKMLADKYPLATEASVGKGLTGAMHLFGAEKLCMSVIEDPGLVDAYLEFEHQLNLHFMKAALDLGVDIVVRNGFYETCDFYSPQTLESLLGRRLRAETDLVHKGGRVICYVLNTGVMPMLEYLDTLDFDCIRSLDVSFKGFDLAVVRKKLGDKKSFWVGPSSTADISLGSPETVRNTVRRVFDTLGKKGLLISACPTSHSIMPWENTAAMIDEWKRLR